MSEHIEAPAPVGGVSFYKLYEAFAERRHLDTQLKQNFRSQAHSTGDKIKELNDKEVDLLQLHAIVAGISSALAGVAGIAGGCSEDKGTRKVFDSLSGMGRGIEGVGQPLFDSLTKAETHEANFLKESIQEIAQTGGTNLSRSIDTDAQVQMQIQTK